MGFVWDSLEQGARSYDMAAAFALQTGAGAAGAGAPSGLAQTIVGIMPMLMVFAIAYFLIFRPQQVRMKRHQARLAALVKNDQIVTSGGLVAKVVKTDDTYAEVEIAPNVRVKVVKATIADVLTPSVQAAND